LPGRSSRGYQAEPFPLGAKSISLFAVLILFDVRDKRPGSYELVFERLRARGGSKSQA
jgi:hypothetical protein